VDSEASQERFHHHWAELRQECTEVGKVITREEEEYRKFSTVVWVSSKASNFIQNMEMKSDSEVLPKRWKRL
jgi:hypothetical protein